MEHGSYEVAILDSSGETIGSKPRKDVDKTRDIYHTVFVLLITPTGEVVLTPIKSRTDFPNLYPQKLGLTIATILRINETAERAAHRAMSRELFIDDAMPHFIGESFETPPDGRPGYMSCFYTIANPPETFSKTDLDTLVLYSPNEISHMMRTNPQSFAPTMRIFWEKYCGVLPI